MEITITITAIITGLMWLVILAGSYSAYKHLINTEVSQLLPSVKTVLRKSITHIIIPLALLSATIIGFCMFWGYLKFTDAGANTIALLVLVAIQYILTMTVYAIIVDKVNNSSFKRIEREIEKVTNQ